MACRCAEIPNADKFSRISHVMVDHHLFTCLLQVHHRKVQEVQDLSIIQSPKGDRGVNCTLFIANESIRTKHTSTRTMKNC